MDAVSKRPWYRLHVGTVLVVFLVGLSWAGATFPSSVPRLWQGPDHGWLDSDMFPGEGWPIRCVVLFNGRVFRCYYPGLVANSVLGAACLLAVAFVVERIERSALVVHLSTILMAVAVLAMLFEFWRYDLQLAADHLSSWSRYCPLTLLPWHQSVPVFLALACLAFTVLKLALFVVSVALRPLRRLVPRGTSNHSIASPSPPG